MKGFVRSIKPVYGWKGFRQRESNNVRLVLSQLILANGTFCIRDPNVGQKLQCYFVPRAACLEQTVHFALQNGSSSHRLPPEVASLAPVADHVSNSDVST